MLIWIFILMIWNRTYIRTETIYFVTVFNFITSLTQTVDVRDFFLERLQYKINSWKIEA